MCAGGLSVGSQADRFSADESPHLIEMATEYNLRAGFDFGNEFEFGLSVILAITRSIPNDGSEARLDALEVRD